MLPSPLRRDARLPEPRARRLNFTEDFSTGTLGPNLSPIIGAVPSVTGGKVNATSTGYVGTIDADYRQSSFLATIEVDPFQSTAQLYFGFGRGSYLPDPGDNFGNPASGPVAFIRHFFPGTFDNITITTNDENNGGLTSGSPPGMGEISNVGGVGPGMGAYTLGIRYDATLALVQFLINGVDYAPGVVDVSGYDFTGQGRIFFGGADGTFDNLTIQSISTVPLPASALLLFMALGGLVTLRRRTSA